jgi:hypothetical protein
LFLFVACTFRSCWPLPAVWSKPSSRPVLLPAGQSGLCFRCQRNVQLKGQLLLSPNSVLTTWTTDWTHPEAHPCGRLSI